MGVVVDVITVLEKTTVTKEVLEVNNKIMISYACCTLHEDISPFIILLS